MDRKYSNPFHPGAFVTGPAGRKADCRRSGRCLPIVNDLAQTGTAMVGVSAIEDLERLKSACKGKLTVFGNLNGIEMCRWPPEDAKT